MTAPGAGDEGVAGPEVPVAWHSTAARDAAGQAAAGRYHEGGPQNGVFVQVTGAIEHDIQVPGRDSTLGKLQHAQALGDLGALHKRGRPAVLFHLRDRAAGLSQLPDAARASTNGASR